MLKKLSVWLACCMMLTACDKTPPKPVEMTGEALGTTYSIKIVDFPSNYSVEQLHQKLRTVITSVDHMMSIHRDDSEVSRFNSYSTSDWIKTSPELFKVVEEAQRISQLSGGAFDITLAKVIDLWGFGESMRESVIPPQAEINEALANSGYHLLKVSQQNQSIKKTIPGLGLNLSAIAKGFAVDEVARALLNEGVESYLVEIGGEIRTKGKKAPGNPWRVAIEKPGFYQQGLFKIIELEDQSLATSGDYRKFFEIEGKRYAHTISPETGYPVDNGIASVSVIDSSCMTADALATAFVSMGFEKGSLLAEKHQLAVLWILRSGDELVVKRSTAFNKYWNSQ